MFREAVEAHLAIVRDATLDRLLEQAGTAPWGDWMLTLEWHEDDGIPTANLRHREAVALLRSLKTHPDDGANR